MGDASLVLRHRPNQSHCKVGCCNQMQKAIEVGYEDAGLPAGRC